MIKLPELPSAAANTALYNWFGVAIAALLMLFAALAIHRFGRIAIMRVARPYPMLSRLVDYIDRPAKFVMVVFALQLVWLQAPDALLMLPLLRDASALLLIGGLTWLSVRSVAAVRDAIAARHPLDTLDNLQARRIHTQTRVLARCVMGLIIVFGIASMLMTFPSVRQMGASLLASAGLAGIAAGFAAKPVLGNLIAGLQLALAQPIRLDDVVVIEGEWGRVEEITGSYVVVRIWDQRRLVVPLQWFIEHPFQNWTRNDSQIIGSVFLWVDYRMPLAPLREELLRLCEAAPEWDRRAQVLQVTDANERAMQLRILVSAPDSPSAWDLRCKVREGLLALMQSHYPQFLPRVRTALSSESNGQHEANAPILSEKENLGHLSATDPA